MTAGWPIRCMASPIKPPDQQQDDDLGKENDLRGARSARDLRGQSARDEEDGHAEAAHPDPKRTRSRPARPAMTKPLWNDPRR